ncbi:hypothetical protein MRBLWO14_000975 [Microbacterium sp. LWO14-1.2]|uniref:hypothetical protein n=1 Tax=Microbacterium sp. LWO14-1.2 TaxID=3135263 RepID=UPI0031397223
MSPIYVVILIIGGALFLAGVVLALRFRRQGGVKVRSRKWYLTVILASLGASLMSIPAVHAWLLPVLGLP